MSETTNQTLSAETSKTTEVKHSPKSSIRVATRVPKIPLLLSLLALCGVIYLAYQGVYGDYSIVRQAAINRDLTTKLAKLSRGNQELNSQIDQLAEAQEDLKTAIHNNAPSQTNLIIYQLNALIGSANQSLVLYHDYAAAIKLLNYAKQLLITSSDPVFADIKISLTKDLDNITAQNTFDNVMVATQIDNLYQQSSNLKLAAEVSTTATVDKGLSVWQRFVINLKNSLSGLVKIEKANQSVAEVLIPENESVIRQHLQIDLLNIRQALLTRNQSLWLNSLKDAENILRHYFISDQLTIGQLDILAQLKAIQLDSNQANLDLTMQSLVKLEQLTTRN